MDTNSSTSGPKAGLRMRGRQRFGQRKLRHQHWYWGLLIFTLLVALNLILFRGPIPVEPVSDRWVSYRNVLFEIENLLGPEENRHPAGSPENDAVRDRLIARLQALRLEVTTQPFQHQDLQLTNVLAHRPGKKSARPILVVAHYDSCQFGPGVGDDLAGVGSILETIRALHANSIDREMWFLFTDGEELGLKGALAYRKQPLLPDDEKPLVLNFDARGTEGSVLMFQTHSQNFSLVKNLIGKLAFPRFTNSLMVNVYERLPNDTDFTVFKALGAVGMNFAVIDGAHRYHTPQDNLANISQRSLQHYAAHSFSLLKTVSQWNDADWARLQSDSPAVFFDLAGGPIFVYPEYWNPFLTVVAWLAVAFMWFRYQRLTPLRPRPIAVVFTFITLLIVFSLTVGWALSKSLIALHVMPRSFFEGSTLVAWLFALPPLLMIFGTADWIFSRKHFHFVRLSVWLSQAFLATTTTLLLPGGAYLFHWPLFASILFGWLGARSLAADYWGLLLHALLLLPVVSLLPIALGPANGALLGAAFALVLIPTLPLLAAREPLSPTLLR